MSGFADSNRPVPVRSEIESRIITALPETDRILGRLP